MAAVLPSLPHLTYLSLAGCSELDMLCLLYVSIECPELQHLNIASLQRNEGMLIAPSLTHLDISHDKGDVAGYHLPPGLLHLNMSYTCLGEVYLDGLQGYCPNLRYLDARGCTMEEGLIDLHALGQCRHLEEVLLDATIVGLTHLGWSMLLISGVRLAADLGCGEGWWLEALEGDMDVAVPDAIVLQKQAGLMSRSRDRAAVPFALGVWPFTIILPFGYCFLKALEAWLCPYQTDLGPFDAQCACPNIPVGLITSVIYIFPSDIAFALMLVWGLYCIMHLGLIAHEFALTLGHPANPWALRITQTLAKHAQGPNFGLGVMPANVSVGRWLICPAIKRVRKKRSAFQIISIAAVMCDGGWKALSHVRRMVRMLMRALPNLPNHVLVVTVGADLLYMVYLALMGFYLFGWVCSVAGIMRDNENENEE